MKASRSPAVIQAIQDWRLAHQITKWVAKTHWTVGGIDETNNYLRNMRSQLNILEERLLLLHTAEAKRQPHTFSKYQAQADYEHRILQRMATEGSQLWSGSPITFSQRMVVADLQAIRNECELILHTRSPDHTSSNHSYLAVVTEPITLSDEEDNTVPLGRFEIRVQNKLWGTSNIESIHIVALDPNPAATSEAITHPHVKAEHLCWGDGQLAASLALRQGRIYDLFQLAVTILQTYNEGSPYVSLGEWNKDERARCAQCDIRVMDGYYCDQCHHTVCEECASSCDRCGLYICFGCRHLCDECGFHLCAECSRTCEKCGVTRCTACMPEEQEKCKRCLAEEQEADEPAAANLEEPL